MAQPSVANYNLNGWCNTGRTDKLGDWFDVDLTLKSAGSIDWVTTPSGHWEVTRADAMGRYTATFAGTSFDVKPVFTWQEYPVGPCEVVWQGGVPIAGSNATIKQSYDEAWTSSRRWFESTTIHPVELRWYCVLWTLPNYPSAGKTTVCYWFSNGGGSDLIDNTDAELFVSYVPSAVADVTVSLDLRRLIDCKEQVWIDENVNDANPANCENKWWLRDTDPHQWMAQLDAEYRIVSNETGGTFIADGLSLNGTTHRRPAISYTWSSSKTFVSKAGMLTVPDSFGYGLPAYPTLDKHVSASEVSFCMAKIGLTDMDLRLGRDASNVPIEYTGDTSYGSDSCSARAEDNELEYLSTKGGNGYAIATWTNLGISYQWDGDVRYVDGSAVSPTPEFEDNNGKVFSGATSPIYVYSGTWNLHMYALDGASHMTNHSPETDWVTDHWQRTENAPASFYLTLTNSTDYSDCGFEEADPNADPPATITKDDGRILLQYPRERHVVSFSTQNYELDDMTALGSGGWVGVNCDVAVVSGEMRITNVEADAYIYRDGFLRDLDEQQPRHWPFYRFFKVVGTSKPSSVVVKRTVGQDAYTKTFSHCFDTIVGAIHTSRYDSCRPDESDGTDVTQSGITQTQPEATEEDVPFMELSSTSWSWGILGFDTIEIHLTEAQDYTFYSLNCSPSSGTEYHDHGVEVEREYNKYYWPGDILLSAEAETYIRQRLYRQCIINSNGRWCAEIPSVRKQTLDSSGLVTFSNYSLKAAFIDQRDASVTTRNSWGMFPPDDFGSWDFTASIPAFLASMWDEVNECYVSEDVLFAADCCPVGFLSDLRHKDDEHDPYGNATQPRGVGEGLYARPLYDVIKGDSLPWFGDGADRGNLRYTCATFRFTKRLRARIQGEAFRGSRTPDEYEPPQTGFVVPIGSDNINSDAAGHFRSGQYQDTSEVRFIPPATASPLNNRTWFRVAGILSGKGLAAVYWKRSGRLYLAYGAGDGITLRIYEGDGSDYVERITGRDSENSIGIDVFIARADVVRVVYDNAGSVYSIQSTSEGNTWSDPVSICTGEKPAIAFNPVDGFEILAYVNGSNVEVRRNLGDGTFGAAIVVCSATADTLVAVTPVTDSRTGTWVLAVRDATANVTRYTSTDGGSTWTADV